MIQELYESNEIFGELTKIPLVREIQIRDYKNIKEARIEFRPGINLIVGKKRTGKTTVLQFILSQAIKKSKIKKRLLFELKQEFSSNCAILLDSPIERLACSDKLFLELLQIFKDSNKQVIITLGEKEYSRLKSRIKMPLNVINTNEFTLFKEVGPRTNYSKMRIRQGADPVDLIELEDWVIQTSFNAISGMCRDAVLRRRTKDFLEIAKELVPGEYKYLKQRAKDLQEHFKK